MESTPGELSGNTEDVTGRKKSRFKLLKVRLFGRLKKKETEGRMKQSQSAGDVTEPDGRRGEDDSEDDCQYTEGTLNSRALSHDSIFLGDQVQSSEPTRVLSQENVHSKIKALQLKLQQQNIRIAPPMTIPGRRMEDSGATSEDDGLPRSPPEITFQQVVTQKGASKHPKVKNNLSWLSLAGTGSEEDEQGGFSQPSSRPLSPVCQSSAKESALAGVDFSSPAQYVPILDNSAARHRLSVKPRNQRASTKGKKPDLYRPRSSSMNSLDLPLSESEETQQSIQPFSDTSVHSGQVEETVPLPSCANLQEEPENVPQFNDIASNFNYTATEVFLQADDATSVCPDTATDTSKGPASDNQHNTMVIVHEDHQASTSLIPLLHCQLDITSENVLKPTTAGSADEMASLCTTIDGDFPKPEEMIPKTLPVPVTRTKKPASLNPDRLKVLSVTPTDAEKETALPSSAVESREEDKPVRPSSFRFNIASAKHRSKTGDENVAKQDEERSGNAHKGQGSSQTQVENTKCIEACRKSPTDKRSSLWREVIGQSVSKTGAGDNAEKSADCPQNAECLQGEKAEESEDRRGLFGVKLRSTSLSLRYRSELPKSDAEFKRHSLECHHLTVKDPVCGDVEVVSNDRKTNALANSPPQSLDSHDSTVDKDSRPEPAWKSLTREKAKVHQSIKPPTQPTPPASSTSLSTSQTSSTQQLSKPSLQPKPPLPATSKPQPTHNPPTTAQRPIERWNVSNQREEKSSVSQPTIRHDQLELKGQSKLGAKSSAQTEPAQQTPSDKEQPTWMELAKRKSLAWSDRTLDSIHF